MDPFINPPNITSLSHELLCHIIDFLPLCEVLSVAMLCKKLSAAVEMHLRLCKSLDFSQGEIFGYMPASVTDDHMHVLLEKCPKLEAVYGLHPLKVERRRLRKRSALTVPGIIEALFLCPFLKKVETSDLRLLEGIMQHLPQVEIIGRFRNRDGTFPPQASQRLRLQPYPRITSLYLTGVEVPELTSMPELQHLHLQWVRFTRLHPFRAFKANNLRTFVMRHCMGPSVPMRYLSLFIALSSAPSLTRLELVRVPLPGGLIQRAVEDTWKNHGFRKLRTLVIGTCKGILESDLGHLMIVASQSLECLSVQPSLTKDSLFVSLIFAHCDFSKLHSLHLGYVDDFPKKRELSNEFLLSLGLAEVPDIPSSLTDSGMKIISQLFPNVRTLSVCNCPHLMSPNTWTPEGEEVWKNLIHLTLQRCHCLRLPSFSLFLALLNNIETVILEDMFREPPKGCSHVGLSAGTGLGMSSAVVSNQDEHIAIQGHQHDAQEQQIDEPMAILGNNDNELELNEIEEEIEQMRVDNQERLLVLQEHLFEDREDNYDVVGSPELFNDIREEEQIPVNEASNQISDMEDLEVQPSHCLQDFSTALSKKQENVRHDGLNNTNNCDTPAKECDKKFENDFSEPSTSSGRRFSSSVNHKNESKNSMRRGTGNTDYGQNSSTSEYNLDVKASCSKDVTAEHIETDHNRNAHQSENVPFPEPHVEKSSSKRKHTNLNQPSTSKCTTHATSVSDDVSSLQEQNPCADTSNLKAKPAGSSYMGPLTRQRKRMLSENNASAKDYFSQGTQATSDDIRRSLARQKASNSAENKAAHNTSSQNKRMRKVQKSSASKSKTSTSSQPDALNKATSTSDPLLEEDAIQILRAVSQTLLSLTVISCGISDIVIDHCLKLMHVEVQACRILKKCSLHHCPSLKRLGFSQCPKLDLSDLATEMLHLERSQSTIVYIEPCSKSQEYKSHDIEQSILGNAGLNQNVVLIHDYSPNDDDRGMYRENLFSWLKLFNLMTAYVLEPFTLKLKSSRHVQNCIWNQKYPWGHHLRRIQGKFIDGRYEMLTNNSVLAAAWQRSEKFESDIYFPCPESSGFHNVSDVVLLLRSDIAEWLEIGNGRCDQFLGFYVHVAETETR